MITKMSDMLDRFMHPLISSRPLTIAHGFDGLIKAQMPDLPDDDYRRMDSLETYGYLNKGLEMIRDRGFGGVVANVSFDNYLEDEREWGIFLQGVKACRELGLRLWIYDEEGYPSGAAGGLVLRGHPELEAQVLVRSRFNVQPGTVEICPPSGYWYHVQAIARCGAASRILTDVIAEGGVLTWDAPEPCTIERYDVRRAFEGVHASRNYHAVRRYINVLDPEAVKRFYHVTEQAYIDRMGADFNHVEAVFTDEPSFMTAYMPEIDKRRSVKVDDLPSQSFDALPQLPWRSDLPEVFKARAGYDLLPQLPSLFEGDSSSALRVRHDFHQLVSQLYADVFFEGLQRPLRQYGMPLTGHVLAEESIISHVALEGSVMGNLKKMEKPGIDMLYSSPERILNSFALLTCKYGSSAAHMCGRDDIMCEASDFSENLNGQFATIEQRRGALAAQIALGITTFTSYYGWREFKIEEIQRLLSFCGRLHQAVRYGIHVAPVAVFYPIRTAWAYYLPGDKLQSQIAQPEPLASLDAALLKIARTLIGERADFDFVDSESFTNSTIESGRIGIAGESYELLVLPPGAVLCSEDVESVRKFAQSGGRILAFCPLSQVNLSPSAESPEEILKDLALRFPDKVEIADIGSAWVDFVNRNIHRDLTLLGGSDSVIVRQSRFADGNVFVAVNASPHPTSVKICSGDCGKIRVLNPWDGTERQNEAEVEIEGYGARIICS